MRFIQQQGFTVKAGRAHAFQEWVSHNEERWARSYPEGTTLLGVYVAVFSSEKKAGTYFGLEQVDSYAALDRLAAAGKDPQSEYSKVLAEFMQFVEFGPTVPASKVLLKAVSDATVYQP